MVHRFSRAKRARFVPLCLGSAALLAAAHAPARLVAASGASHAAGTAPRAVAAGLRPADWEGAPLGSIDRQVFDLALGAAACAIRAGVVANPPTLTVIDYSKPSTVDRLWVFDLRSRALLYQELVAHGQGSGGNLSTAFSNDPDSHQSSLGLFVTEDTYTGKNGYSLRLNGLDGAFNDRARERAIVLHGASYVSPATARALGRLGRSWGCPALSEAIAHQVIDRVKGGGLLFSYYPDKKWLAGSKFLGSCGTPAA